MFINNATEGYDNTRQGSFKLQDFTSHCSSDCILPACFSSASNMTEMNCYEGYIKKTQRQWFF